MRAKPQLHLSKSTIASSSSCIRARRTRNRVASCTFASRRMTLSRSAGHISSANWSPPKSRRRGRNLLFVVHDPEGQLLEYTQYLPESLHSRDHGKHIGAHRISGHLLEATSAVKDIAAERAFYTTKLDFRSASPLGAEFFIAGHSSEKVMLQPQTPPAGPRISFGVTSVRKTARELRARGFQVQASRLSVSVVDPDGAILSFVSTRDPR